MSDFNVDEELVPPIPEGSPPPLPPPPMPVEPAPPLHMQTSNHNDAEWLDFGHGGGGDAEPASPCEVGGGDRPSCSYLKRTRASSSCNSSSSSDRENGDEPLAKLVCRADGDLRDGNGTGLAGGVEQQNDSMGQHTASAHHSNGAMEMEFDILDEVEAGGVEYDSEDSGSHSDSDSDIPYQDIEAMLEEGLARSKDNNDADDADMAHEEREKVVLKVKGQDHFDVLPEGWIEVTHNSGMPIYLHKQSRVCTMAKPYFLGPGSARKHEIPISAIPCLHYRKEQEKENAAATQPQSNGSAEENQLQDATKIPSAKVESVQDSKKEHSLDYLAVREYCQKLFEFQTITIRRFRTWAGRRKHQKLLKQQQRPSLPESTKLITCPLPVGPEKGSGVGNAKREFIMNPSGKSYVCILHEYVQHAMRVQPRYIFRELENASMPYGATVVINDMEYGSGYGSSKKQAKSQAAKATLEILIPEMKKVTMDGRKAEEIQQDLAFFDEVKVEDPRVSELCAKAGQPSPYQILLECLKRNYGMGDTQIKFEMKNLKHQKNEFMMTVGRHYASVICKNKRDGKQRASQAILQALHPHVTSWGSLLRLYGKSSCKTLKEKKEEEQRITELQSRASANKPNMSILNKLREEMAKLKARREAVRPIGKFIPQEMELPSTSSSDLKNVDL